MNRSVVYLAALLVLMAMSGLVAAVRPLGSVSTMQHGGQETAHR